MTANKPGLDLFWEQADRTDSDQNPIERELDERVDALARYRRLIDDAEANGQEEAVEILIRQHDREQDAVQRLRDALNRNSDDGDSASE